MLILHNLVYDDRIDDNETRQINIRVYIDDSERLPWFRGREICKASGHEDIERALEYLVDYTNRTEWYALKKDDDDEDGNTCRASTHIDKTTPGQWAMNEVFLSEVGLLQFMYRSHLPGTHKLNKWFTMHALPYIHSKYCCIELKTNKWRLVGGDDSGSGGGGIGGVDDNDESGYVFFATNKELCNNNHFKLAANKSLHTAVDSLNFATISDWYIVVSAYCHNRLVMLDKLRNTFRERLVVRDFYKFIDCKQVVTQADELFSELM